MKAEVKIVDLATPKMKRLADKFPTYFPRALKSTGWWMREEIKAGIRAGAPGGVRYAPYSPVTKTRVLDSMRGRGKTSHGRWRAPRRLAEHKPMGRLYQATRYKYHADSRRVRIGWISKTAEELGTVHERGKHVRITPRMRRFFWAAGIPLRREKSYIYIPKRLTYEPEYRAKAPLVAGYIQGKISEYLKEAEVL